MQQLREVIKLSVPVVMAELGWMFMGVVDTIMVGPLGPSAIGAVSVAGILFDALAIFGIGLLLGLDTLVSQAWGAGNRKDCDRSLWQALYIAAAAAPLLILCMQALPAIMRASGVHAGVLALGVPYLNTLEWGFPPLLVYAAFRRYLQGIGQVRIVTFALISANLINAAGNSVLIPRMEVEGAGWATFISRVYLMLVLVLYAAYRNRAVLKPYAPDFARIRELLSLGIPAALQILLEIGVFAVATVLAGKLAPHDLAAHHVALNIAGTTFMIPLGVSSAGSVLVGHAIGRGDPAGAKRSGWMSLALGGGFMLFASVCILLFHIRFLAIFTKNTDVLRVAVPLLFVAAVFQIFDGVQVVTTGILRGAGNTRTAMLANLMGHWLLGLPAGYLLCFHFGFGVIGLWMGLSLGLIVVGSTLLLVWHRAVL